MNAENPNEGGQGVNPQQASLAMLNERALLQVVLEAVQAVDWSLAQPMPEQDRQFRPRMMLTLLAYCYAAGIYGSREIERATRTNRMVRYICAHQYPDWMALRRFRRHNRELLKQCLLIVLKQSWALKFDEAEADYLGYNWFESELNPRLEAAAQDKLDLAIIMDRAESEE